jgi:nucleotide-binding universal stress UspA family protein
MRLVVATDGSAAAQVAVDLVAGAEWPVGTIVRVVQAVETGAALFGGPWPAVAELQAGALESEIRRVARDAVEQARARLAKPGLEVDAEVLTGRPASVIVETATEMAADAIVVGSRGHGAIDSMLLGSVSAEVVDRARVPVLVARGTSIARVMVAWDGSDCARLAAGLVRGWPVLARSAVRVLSVADVGPPWWAGFPDAALPALMPMYIDAADALRRLHDELARDLTAELQAAGIDAAPERRDGDPATEIIAAAKAGEVDLVVMGTHGRSGIQRVVLGSVARNVLQHVRCSVLIAPEPGRAAGSERTTESHGEAGR